MGLREIFRVTRGTKIVLLICTVTASGAIAAAFFHYRKLNRAEDPVAVAAARYVMSAGKAADEGNHSNAMAYLDSAMNVLSGSPVYTGSYEPGIIHNNRAGVLLMQALYHTRYDTLLKKRLLMEAGSYCDSAIYLYSRWIDIWGKMSRAEIEEKITMEYRLSGPPEENISMETIVRRRISKTLEATTETPRRLSVALTNKATVYRHLLQPDSALVFLDKALKLWEDNHTARSNLSVLMGGKPVKPGIVKMLFPPDRIKRNNFDL